MFPERRRDQEGSSPGSQSYAGALSSLRQKVIEVEGEVAEIKNNLEKKYPTEALDKLSSEFEKISQTFNDYITIERSSYYEIIHRSDGRLKKTKSVIKAAEQVAVLFERYARSAGKYSPVKSRLEIGTLLGKLRNLEESCK